MERHRYLSHAEPEPVPFYGYAMLTRFTAKNSDILAHTWNQPPPENLFFSALRSPKGHLTLIFANRAEHSIETQIKLEGLSHPESFHRYELTEPALKTPGFTLKPIGRLATQTTKCSIPANSLVVFTTFDLAPDAPGITSEK